LNILYIASSSDFHIDLWTQYFAKKHDVYLFSEKEDYLGTKPYSGVTILYVYGILTWLLNLIHSNSHRLHKFNKFISKPIYTYRLKKYVKKYKIDIVHAHSTYQGWIASDLDKDTKVIFTPMGSDVIIHAQSNPIYKYMAKKAFQRADIVTNDSKIQQEKGFLLGANKKNNHIIQNGVDSKLFYPKENKLREQLSIKNNEFLLFSPRGLDEIYNIDKILCCIRELTKKKYEIKCMITYPFGQKKLLKLKQLVTELDIEEHIIWIGGVNYSDMPLYYNAADLIISIPSSDSSPKSVYEAMFCQKPVIVSDIDWVYENVGNKNCVIKTDLKKESNLQEEIIKIIENESYRSKISCNARTISKKYYDYYINMDKMEQIMLNELNTTKL
jgi:glycosyltransferase involved in cell wall biosynthesis